MHNGNCTSDLAKKIQCLEAERTRLKKELESLQKAADRQVALKLEKAKTKILSIAVVHQANTINPDHPETEMPPSLSCIKEENKKKNISYVQLKNERKRKIVQMDNALNKVIIEELENLLKEYDQPNLKSKKSSNPLEDINVI